ncbi:MAG: hypothetical protein JXR48_17670 [Candidatus Delongbacteria bacterium]|nr:hypothetical protein [Candidatus Delongbacteria bacterium]MBN2836787.1 hypothetical protein [Candidatus Delongbacteria bacterium]
MENTLLSSLISLGLTNMEAEIYINLNQNPGITGYGISKLMGKSRTNIYSSLESLKNKGFILENNTGKNSEYIAVELNIISSRIKKQIDKNIDTVKLELSKIQNNEIKDGVYQIQNYEDSILRAIEIINNSNNFLMVDSFPGPLSVILPFLKEALNSKPNLIIYLKCYDKTTSDHKNLKIITAPDIDFQLKKWQGEWLFLTSDCEQSFLSCFKQNQKGIFHTIWIKNVYLTGVLHNGIYSEMQATYLYNSILAGVPHSEILAGVKFLSPSMQFYMEKENNNFLKISGGEFHEK